MDFEINKIYRGNCIEIMKQMPPESVDMTMTSPPYKGPRDYGKETEVLWEDGWFGQLGRESTYKQYCLHLREVGRQIWRVTKPWGSFFLNIGDLYAQNSDELPNKCMLNIPERLAISMTDEDRWIQRDLIIWFRRNHMPFSGYDRLAPSYEFIYHFTKAGQKPSWWRHKDKTKGQNGWVRERPTDPQKCLVGYEIPFTRLPKTKEQEDIAIRRGWKKDPDFGTWLKPKYEFLWHTYDYYFDLDSIRVPLIYPPQMEQRKNIAVRKDRPIEAQFSKEKRYDYQGKFNEQDDPEAFGSPRARHMRTKLTSTDYEFGMISAQKRANLNGEKGGREMSNPLGKNPSNVIELSPETRPKEKLGGVSRWGPNHPMLNPERWFNPNGKNPGDFWDIVTHGYEDAHFAVYPFQLCYNPIISCSPANGIVFDPFSGSGSTLYCAKLLMRNYIGIEVNSSYVTLAETRLAHLDSEINVLNSILSPIMARIQDEATLLGTEEFNKKWESEQKMKRLKEDRRKTLHQIRKLNAHLAELDSKHGSN